MTAPSIEMIAESLKNCSLGRNRGGRARAPPVPPPHPEEEEEDEDEEDDDDESEGLTVELNSDVALPRNWEQCLDMRTGEVFYVNWRTGMRTKEDPRNPVSNLPSKKTCYCSESSFSGSGDNASSSDEEEEEEETRDTASSSGISSICSSSSGEVVSGGGGGGGDITGQVLVAAGCKACFMYFMVPKRVEACPKCGAALLYL